MELPARERGFSVAWGGSLSLREGMAFVWEKVDDSGLAASFGGRWGGTNPCTVVCLLTARERDHLIMSKYGK